MPPADRHAGEEKRDHQAEYQADRDPFDGPVGRPLGAAASPNDDENHEWAAERDEGHRAQEARRAGAAVVGSCS